MNAMYKKLLKMHTFETLGITKKLRGGFKMRRKIAMILAGVLVFALPLTMTGCGSSQGGSDGTSSTSSVESNESNNTSNEKVKITYSAWGGAEDKATEEALVEAFMAQNENIEVEYIHVDGNYEEKLQTLIAGGETPDVMAIGSAHIPSFASAFTPLDEELGADAEYISDFVKEALVYDGKLYALPKRCNTIIVAYNKTLLEEAGVSIPGVEYTIEQFTEDAKKIAALDDDIYGACSLFFRQWIYQFGGQLMNNDGQVLFNSEEGLAAAQYMYDAIEEYKFAPNVIEAEGEDMLQWFISERVGFILNFGPWNMPTMSEVSSFEWDVCATPGNGGKMEIVGLAMGKDTEHPEAVQAFIEFISTSKEAQEIVGSSSALPVTEDGKEAFLNQYPDKNLQAFFDAMSYQEVPNQIKGADSVVNTVENALKDRTAIGTGTEDVATVLKEAEIEAQELLDEANE